MAPAGIDWQGDPEAAFAEARERGVPVLLYWGAVWCPPCNRIKSLVFGRPDFIALSASFVALAIDGDSPGAQRLAEQLKLRSYPTLVVVRPDGAEITRLPSELDGKRFVHILELAVNARYTAGESLSVALSRERALSDDEWRLLSFYSWDTDERQLLKNLDFAAIVASLTRACSLPEAAMRLEWLGLHAAAMAGETGVDQAAAIARLETTLNDPAVVCQQLDIVIGYALDLVRFLTAPGSAARLGLIASWSRALEVLENDATLNLCDRLGALRTRVRLNRLGGADAALAGLASERVAMAAALADSSELRHAVINSGAGILIDAGRHDEAATLLKGALEESHSPFYFMHTLAGIAKRCGDPAGALEWYERAWQGATGSATRIQWGTTWLLALLDLAPGDSARIERCAGELAAEIAATGDAGCQRNRTQGARIAKVLSGRDELGEQLQRLRGLVQPT